MTDAELALRLRETLSAAQRRYRTARGMGCIVTPRIPDGLIDEFAAGIAPVMLELAIVAAELVAERAQAEHLERRRAEQAYALAQVYEATATPKDAR